ncbi:hypothetical protein SSYM_1823, partial [Serratia symbiotica str. Tucson]
MRMPVVIIFHPLSQLFQHCCRIRQIIYVDIIP